MASQTSIYRFGPFESRLRTKELFKHGVRIKVRPQPLQVLNMLLKAAGDVVTREELRAALWSSETFVDFENGLNTSVKELRAVLGDSASEPRYIETLPKLGYRFIAEVEPVASAVAASETNRAANEASEGSLVDAAEDRSSAATSGGDAALARNRPRFAWAGALALIAVAALGAMYWHSHARAAKPLAPARITIAVLPFENLTGDPSQEYFSDGLTDEMIAHLERLNPARVGVIARTSVMHYKKTNEALPQIGRELSADYVMEGSVRRDSDKVRIDARLIRVNDQTPLWSRQYDRTLEDLFALQDEIAHEAGDEILASLSGSEKTGAVAAAAPASLAPPKTQATPYAAYDLYLSGRYFWNKRTSDGFRQAADYFKRAIEKDPTYAPAYAGLADTYAMMSSYAAPPDPQYAPLARAAAVKAVELDDTLAEAHTSLALVAQNYDYDWPTAEREYKRATELDPEYATAHHWYAEYLAFQGRFDESFAEYGRARQLDPLSLVIATDYAMALYYARQYPRAIEQFGHVQQMDPTFPRAHNVASCYIETSQNDRAMAELDQLAKDSPTLWELSTRANLLAREGRTDEARATVAKLASQSTRGTSDPLQMAVATMLIDKDASFHWLRLAYEKHSPGLTSLKVDPMFDPMRGDPRFAEYLRLLRFS